MQTQSVIGQDVLYNRNGDKGECPAKVVRVIDPTKNIVNLVIFTDDSDNGHIQRNVPYSETGSLEHAWRHEREQARGVGSSR